MPIHVQYTPPEESIDPGIYLVRVDGIAAQPNSKYEGTLRWTFTIIDGRVPHYFNKSIFGMSSSKASPKSKLFQWLRAFGISLDMGQTFDLESLIGKQVIANVENSTSVTNGHEVTYSNVKDLLPANNMPIPMTQQQPVQQTAHVAQQPVQAARPAVQQTQANPYPTQAATPIIPNNQLKPEEDIYNF